MAGSPKLDAEAEFTKATSILKTLLGLPHLRDLLDDQDCVNAAQVYTNTPTIWLLIVQRLGGGLSLSQAVSDLLAFHRELLPANKRVREEKLSENNSAYSRARQRISLEVIERFSRGVCDHLASMAPRPFLGKRVFVLDGTTITLPPTPELQKRFPPATNQFGKTVWPVAMLLVAHELQTGCALLPEVAAMYGPDNRSESSMAKDMIERLPEDSIVMGDSGFGIFHLAHHCSTQGRSFVFRLTRQRFLKMQRSARLVDQGKGYSTYHLLWKPSSKDRQSLGELANNDVVGEGIEVFLHQIALPDEKTLEIVSNVQVDAPSVGELYRSRYDVEFDIRDLKVTMDTENIRARSYDTMMKELMGSVIAFNLVMQFRRQAATLINKPARELSFRGVWTTFQNRLLRQQLNSYEEWEKAYRSALERASCRRLPKRSKPRSSPRQAHPRRQKTTKFQKSLRKKKTETQPPSPNSE